MPDYSFPTWILPKHSPWEAMLAGVQAGSQIAATRQRGMQIAQQQRQLDTQIHHQALQDTILQQKYQDDVQDMTALREWYSSGADPDKVPFVRNPQVMNQVQGAAQEKRMQAGVAELSTMMPGLDLTKPEDQVKYFSVFQKHPGLVTKSGGFDEILKPVQTAETAKRLKETAASLATYREGTLDVRYMTAEERERHNLAMEDLAERNKDREEFEVFYDGKTQRWYQRRSGVFHPVSAERGRDLSPSGRLSGLNNKIQELQFDMLLLKPRSPEWNTLNDQRKKAIEDRNKMLEPGEEITTEPAAPTTTAPADAGLPTATNPATGEKIVYKDGKWQPVK